MPLGSTAYILTAALLLFGDVAYGSSWHLASPLPEPRWFHSAGVGSDGRIYVYSGYVRGSNGKREYGIGEHALVIYDALTNTWKRGPGITSVKVKGLGRLLRGWVDEHGKKQREFVLEETTSTIRVSHEGPTGRADPFGRPRWPGPVVLGAFRSL